MTTRRPILAAMTGVRSPEETPVRPAAMQAAPAEAEPARRWTRRDLAWEAAWAAGAGLVSLLLAGWVLRIWDMSLHVPLVADGDGVFGILLVKLLESQTWLGVNPDLGYPFGSATYDMTTHYSDFSQLLILKALTLVADSPPAIVNTFFLLTFPLVTVSAYAVLRGLRFERLIAAVCAVVYALLPFHFLRSEAHLFLSAYYAAPVGCWLALGALGRVPLVRRRPDAAGWRAYLTAPTLVTVAACLLAGSSDGYFAVLSASLILAAGLIRVLAERRARVFATAAVLATLVLGTLVVVEAPTILWHQANGANELVAQRSPYESEFYGLKLINLVLPQPDHRIGPLDDLSRRHYSKTSLTGEGPLAALGTLLTVGFVFILAAVVAAAAGRRPRNLLARDAGLLTGAAFVIGTVGGVSALVSYLVTPTIRAWNRISPLIAFLALIGLAILLTRAWERYRPRTVVAALAAAALLAFATFDQTTERMVPNHEGTLAQWRIDANFVRAAEQALPPRAPVYQLPYVPFPENPPVNRMNDYDLMKGYLHSDDLRWSYGAMKSREPDDWQRAASSYDVEDQITAAAAAGFEAVYVDTFGFEDGGADVVRRIESVLGTTATVVSQDGRLLLYDLAPLDRRASERPELEEALLRAVSTENGPGFYDPEPGQVWARAASEIRLENPGRTARRVRFEAAVATPGTAPARVTFTGPDVSRTVTSRPAKETGLRLFLTLPPGTSTLKIRTDAPDEPADPRDLRLRLIAPRLVDEQLERAAEG